MTDATPNLEQPLNINGTLRVEADGQAFDVRAEDNRVVVDLPSVGVLKALLPVGGQPSRVNALTSRLNQHDLEVVVQLKGQTIATLGRSAEPGAFEKLFNLEGLDLKFRELAKAWFKRSD
ncbi:MAG: hypothetical protein AAF593_08960 [Planctomycetota bacterium]